jgi:hypothetical protein
MFAIAESEHARAEKLDNPESIYRACADMKLFNQEVLRVILLDARYRHISTVEITKGSINESLAYPRDIFRPVIGQSAYAFVLAHNLWAATHRLCYVKRGFMCGLRWSKVDALWSGPQRQLREHLRWAFGRILSPSFGRDFHLRSSSPQLSASHN